MMAARAGFTTVYACDESKVMYSISRDILHSNGLSDRVELFHKNSADLSVVPAANNLGKGETGDICAPSIIVTETVDCGESRRLV